MSHLRRLAPPVLCIAAILVAVTVGHLHEARRIDQISALGNRPPAVDTASETGYAGGARNLVVPGRNAESMQWIIQTQRIVHEHSWRIRQAWYDNAPLGRPVHAPSPFRWWLAAVAQPFHLVGGHSAGLAVERAALWAEPILHLIAIAGTSLFVLWRFGRLASIATASILAFSFPFAGMFQPGAPEDSGLAQVLLLTGMLLLLDAASHRAGARRMKSALSAACCATALWLDPGDAVPIIGGLCISGVVIGLCLRRRSRDDSPQPTVAWRAWGLCGAGMTLAAYLVEFAPANLSWTEPGLSQIHPLYALAWIGAAEVVHRVHGPQAGASGRGWRGWAMCGLAIAALLALPLDMYLGSSHGFLQPGLFANRLTPILGGISGADVVGLVRRDGLSLAIFAAIVPALLILVPLAQAIRCGFSRGAAPAPLLLLGPGLLVVLLAWHRLGWWSHFGPVAALLAVALTARAPAAGMSLLRRAGRALILLALFFPGIWIMGNHLAMRQGLELSAADQLSLIERDLGHWLAQRAGGEGGIVLAPPETTVSMIYYGGLGGLGSLYRENQAGFGAAVRICAATSADEAEVLVRQRALTHIVMPTWDPFLDEYARLGTTQVQTSLVALLHAWLPPRWLRPAAYYPPPLPNFAGERVNVFEVTEVQEQVLALSRLAEYFIDMRDAAKAAELGRVLAERFPDDISARTAIARGQLARGERFSFAKSVEDLLMYVSEGAADYLPWDRRVSLVLMLAAGEHPEEAREQAAWCAETATEGDVRQLSLPALFRFAKLCEQYSLQLAEPSLERLMRERVPDIPAADTTH